MFYVYTLTDPRCGSVFYVGKGKGNRALHHERDARGTGKSNRRKLERIREIIACGLEIQVSYLAYYDIEQDAIDHEAELIAVLPGLTNIMASGRCNALTKEEAQRRLDVRQTWKTRAKLREFYERAKSWKGVTFPSLKNGDALADEWMAYVGRVLDEPLPII